VIDVEVGMPTYLPATPMAGKGAIAMVLPKNHTVLIFAAKRSVPGLGRPPLPRQKICRPGAAASIIVGLA
jgi:hypothetical protein